MKIIFIPKPNKEDYSVAKSFRPITLSSGLLKGMEKIVKGYMIGEGIKLPNQYAFRKGCSTETALSKVYDELEKSYYNGKIGIAAFLDIEGAFDRVPFKIIRKAMKRHNINPFVLEWYDFLVRYRTVRANIKGNTITVRPGRGTPQGGVLSPLIWNLVIDKLLVNLENRPIKPTGFADDICVTLSGDDVATMWSIMQSSLNHVVRWGNTNGLTFNPGKTQILVCTRKKKVTFKPFIISGKAVEFVSTVKYLGINMSNNLKWKANLDEKIKKAKVALNTVKSLVGKEWGLDPMKAKWLYTAIARPVITYGSIVWAEYPTNKYVKQEFSRIQRLAAMMISGGLSTSPTAGLEIILDLVPLEIQSIQLATEARIRSKCWLMPNWDGLGLTGKGHHRRLDNVIGNSITTKGIKYNYWEKQWSDNTTCKQTKLFFPTPNPIVSKALLGHNRKDLCALVQIFTGHACLKKHLHTIGQVDDPLCRLCMEDEESAFHVALECPALEMTRRQYAIDATSEHTPEWHASLCRFLLQGANIHSLLSERVENRE